jgi:hydroxyacylglutathione hydrolase
LIDRAQQVTGLRIAGEPTVPTIMSLEKATNPFLRAGDPSIRSILNMPDDSDAAVFAEIRHRKDNF